jgi:RNA polymerase sigma factor (sigma-70 family)
LRGAPPRLAEGNKEAPLPAPNEKLARFEAAILPHLDAAYNLARWLTRHEQNAEDVVQEAYMRAYRYFDSFQGDTGRAWLLQIVRKTCYTWLARNRPHQTAVPLNEADLAVASQAFAPGTKPLVDVRRDLVEQALAALTPELREVLVLRELEQLSYKEIAVVADIPLGTVMSRLARGRQQLHDQLLETTQAERAETIVNLTANTQPAPGVSRSVP